MKKFTFYDTGEYRTRKTKRWLGWLTFCMMLLVGQMSLAQTGTIQIGSGAQTATGTAAIPVANYSFNYNQQIVTASEYGLGGGGVGSITKIRYKPTVVGTVTVWNDWTVYIGHTTKTEFTSTTDWVPLAQLTQVFSGVVTTNPVAGDWFEITFTTPFNYTGGNIVIAIDENTAGWSSAPTWSAYTSTPNSGIYYRTDTVANNPDPATPPTATGLTAILPQIQFEGTFATCQLPTNLYVSNITDDSADLGWTEANSATQWDIEWGLQGFTPTGTPTITGTTTNPHHLTGLASNTKYDFYVRSDCGTDDGTSLWVGPYTFKTFACLGAALDITSATGGGICAEGITTLQVTASGLGDDIYWYDAEFGGNLVGQGSSFETPFLTETTSYWAAEVLLDNELFTGQGNLSPTTLGSTTAGGITFVLNQSASILSFEARSTTAAGGAVTYALIDVDNGNSVLMTHSDTLPGGGTAAAPALYTVNLNFLNIPPGTYRLVKQSGAASAYMTGVFPYPLGTVGSITNGAGSATTTSTLYYHFFNITVEGVDVICASEREEVIATVHEIIDIDVTSTDTELLPGESATLSASSTNTNYIYEWTWDGGSTTGASVTVSPTAISTIYTVTATDTVTGCETQGSIEIFTFDPALCDDLEIATTTNGNVCDPGNTTTLQATGSSSMGDAQIFWYDAPTGGNKVGTGTTFTTPALTTTTSYYAAEVLTDGQGVGGTISTNYTAGGLTFFAATTGVGITFAIQNTNSVPVTLNGLDFYMDAGTNQSYQLWYNATNITGAPGIINAANGWVSIAGPLNVSPSGTTNGVYPVFAGIEFEIPANTTYRFTLTGTGAGNFSYYNASGAPNSFSSEGINLLVGDNSAGGTGNVGYSGQNPYTTGINTTPRFFHGALSFNSATILCESEREEVTATVHEIIDIDVTATETIIDAGDSVELTATSTNTNYTYEWIWDDGTGTIVTGTGSPYTAYPTTHTTFTVIATDTVTGCQTSKEIEILVYDLTLCDTIEILTTTDGSVCDEGTVTLSTTASGNGDNIYWYDAPTGGNLVGQGTPFETPELTETTSFWASEVYLDGGTLGGQAKEFPNSTTGYTLGAGLAFTATESFTIVDVTLYSNSTAGGTIPSIQLQTITGTLIAEVNNIPVPAAPGTGANALPFQASLNIDVPGPGDYRLLVVGSVPSLIRDSGATQAGTFPYPLGTSGEITGSILGVAAPTVNTYYYFYNWTVSTAVVICESDREEVIATVHEIDVTASETTIDFGDSTTLSVTGNNPDFTYEWTWDGGTPTTGDSLIVSPTEHTTYTVTATDSVTGCQIVREIEILVYDLTICDDIEILTTTDGDICSEGTVTLSATASGDGDEIYWYDAPTGGNLVGQGATFTTPELTETTSYWVSEVYLDAMALPGQAFANPTTFTNSTSNIGGVLFTVTNQIKIVDVQVFGTNATGGEITIELRDIDNGNATVATTTATITGGGTTAAPIPHTIPLNFDVPPGNYRLVRTGATPTGVGMGYVTAANSDFPYPLGVSGQVTGGATATGTSTIQYFFFNWTIEEDHVICESEREEVTATVHNIDIAATATTIDPGDSVTLTASSTNPNYTYEWTWDGGSATGATITVTPSSHTTYTVTATDSTDPTCQNSAEIQIIVFSTTLCNMLEITSTTDGGICESGSTVLQATGGGTGDNIYWYDAATGGNLVGQGTEFTTPNLTTTTSFWASEVLLADGQGVATGQAKLTPDTTTGYTQNAGLEFVATDSFTIVDVEAYSNAVNGTSIPSLELQDASGNVLQSISNVPIPNGGVGVNAVPFTITLSFNVPGPGTYRLIATGGSFSSLLRDSGASNAQFPHNVGDVAVVTQGVLTNNPTTTSYYYFYNWTVSSGLVLCESDRMEAVALVVPQSSTPPPTGDANQLVSAGTTLAGLNVTGTELTWYSDAALTNEVPDTTLAYEGTYYVTQTLGYCEGLPLAITVTLLCPTPTNLTATPTSLTEVTLSWTGGGDSFEVEWGPAGFTLGNGSSITGLTTNSTNVTTVIDTPYEFYVRQDCGIEGISLWAGPFSFQTGYCTPTSNCASGARITNFVTTGALDDIANSTGSTTCGITSTGYSNYSNISATAVEGTVISFTVGVGNFAAYVKLWVDWNNNGVFEADELMSESTTTTPSNTNYNGSFTVPAGTTPDNYRLRVRVVESVMAFTACSAQTYGETEDYTINVITPPTCMFPQNLSAINTSASSVSLSCTSTGTLFDIEYGPTGFTPGTGTIIPGVGNPYTLGGLTGGMTYDYYVRQDCGVDGVSIWRGPVTFTPGVFEGDIPTLLNENPQVEDIACATSFNIDVPEGQQIASLTVEYVMISSSPFWTSQQRSVLYSSTLGMGESEVVTPGALGADYPGIVPYSREVTFANGATGTVAFELKAWRTSGGTGCSTLEAYVMDGSWVLNATFEPIPTCPNPPTDLGYTNITEDSVDLIWEAEPGTFQIKWGTVGFDIETEGTTISDITTNSYNLSGLDASIAYEFYVRRDCSTDDGEDFGEWAGPFKFNAGYCLPTSDLTYHFSQFNTSEAVSDIIYSNSTGGGTGYVNNTNMIITANAGESFDFTSNYAGGASGLKIWIDWNKNFIFEEDEEVFELANNQGVKTGTISIPADAINGEYRMRVRAQQEATSIPPACGVIDRGQALDFTLEVQGGVNSTSDFNSFAFAYYPNPVGEMLYLKANTEIDQVTIYNMLGQQLRLPIHSGNTQIDMTGLPAGNYVMSVTIEGINKTFKVVKK